MFRLRRSLVEVLLPKLYLTRYNGARFVAIDPRKSTIGSYHKVHIGLCNTHPSHRQGPTDCSSHLFCMGITLGLAQAAKAYMPTTHFLPVFDRTFAQHWLPITADCNRLNSVMSSEGPSLSFFPTSRRSACDRCRKQKLRCPPRENATQSCLRCVRASLPCTTGYIKPLGRSGGDGMATSSHNDPKSAADFNDVSAEGALGCMDLTPLDSQGFPSTAATLESMSSWIVPSSMNDNLSLAQSWSQAPTQDMASNYHLESHLHESLLPDNLLTCDAGPSTTEESNGPQLNDLDRFLSAPTPSELSPGERSLHADSNTKQRQRRVASSGKDILSGAECEIRLSQLSLELSRQRQECVTNSQRGSLAGKENDSSESPFESTSKNHRDQSTSNPFGDALCSTLEFLNILLCYDSSGTSATSSAVSSSHHSRDNSDVSHSSVSFACVLSLLSSYLRIVTIFDSLFHQLYELQCRNGTTSSDLVAGLQTLPDLHLAGFPVQQGILQTKILIQATQHQFELIEKALGLPVELRVSDRPEVYHTGLLQNEWAGALLQAILSGQHGGGGAEMFAFGPVCAVDSLESLKEIIEKVRQLLL